MSVTIKILALLFFITSASGAETCAKLPSWLEAERKELEELTRSLQVINEKFTETVKRDFHAQAEGLMEELHRNEAIKAAFARKKLSRKIEEKRTAVASMKAEYCAKCFMKEMGSGPKAACETCPEESRCRRAPAAKH